MFNFNKNELFSLWIINEPTIINFKCWDSWIRLGYQVNLYVDKPQNIPQKYHSKMNIKLVNTVFNDFEFNTERLLQSTDVWRFKYILKYGGTWIDSDMYLFKRLPHDDIIISSEHTLKSGAFKSKGDLKPNIGVLRFPPNNVFVKAVVNCIELTTVHDINDKKNYTSKMLKYIKLIKSKKWNHYVDLVSEPHIFCPIPWLWAKELFWTKTTAKALDKQKYALNFSYKNDETIGVHLWENIAKQKQETVKKDFDSVSDSFFGSLSV